MAHTPPTPHDSPASQPFDGLPFLYQDEEPSLQSLRVGRTDAPDRFEVTGGGFDFTGQIARRDGKTYFEAHDVIRNVVNASPHNLSFELLGGHVRMDIIETKLYMALKAAYDDLA